MAQPVAVTTVDYHDLSELPAPQQQAVLDATRRTRRRRCAAALVTVALFVTAALCFYFYDSDAQPAVARTSAQIRAQLAAQLQKLHVPVNIALLAGGLALLLAGRRLYTVAFFLAGFLAGGFLGYTVWTTASASLASISAQAKVIVAVVLSVLCGGVLGGALARLERLGTAVVGGCAGFAAGELLFSIALDRFVSAWWGQYATGAVCAAAAFALVFLWERELLVVTSSAAGAYAAAVGGAQLFFQYDPTSADLKAHWKDATAGDFSGDDAHFWEFFGAVLALFALGMLVQTKTAKKKEPQLSFYDEEANQQGNPAAPAVTTATGGVRFI